MSAAVPAPRSVVADPVAELAAGREVDLGSAELPADALATALAAAGGPLRLRGATVTGELALVGARIERPVELLDCTFTVAPRRRRGPPAAASAVASASAGSSAEPRSTSRPAASSATGSATTERWAGTAALTRRSVHQQCRAPTRGPVRRSTHTPTASVAGVRGPQPSGDSHGAAPDVTGSPAGGASTPGSAG